jgi:hypothetical protein
VSSKGTQVNFGEARLGASGPAFALVGFGFRAAGRDRLDALSARAVETNAPLANRVARNISARGLMNRA